MAAQQARSLIPLGEGVYTVSEVCRILQPTMTPRKVHYWLDTDLLSPPVAWGRRGFPTLLSFQQLLEIRTVQRIRDDLEFSLPRVREAFQWILDNLFAPDWRDLRFTRVGKALVGHIASEHMEIPGGQGLLDIPELNIEIGATRVAWDSKVFAIPGHAHVVSDSRILAGAPTVKGTRVETSILASFADDREMDQATLAQIVRLYPKVTRGGIEDALAFEGVRIAA